MSVGAVSGAGHSTTAATLDSVGAQPAAEILNPRNSTSLRNNSVLDDDEPRHAVGSHSALALRLLQPATPPQVVAFDS